jgi:hypothetical protein
MRLGLRALSCALATTFVCAALLASCGGGDEGASADASVTTAARGTTAATTAPTTPPAAGFEFGRDPRFTPVEVALTAGVHGFDADAFASAFADAPDCSLDTYARGRPDAQVDAATIAGTTATVTQGPDADHAVVELTAPGASQTQPIPIVQRHGKWYIEGEPCKVLGLDDAAPARATQSNLRNGLTAAKTIYTDSESYQAATPAYMHEIEPSLQFAPITGARAGVVGIGDVTPNQIVLVTQSTDGEWFCIADVATGDITYGRAATREAIDSVAECTAPSWD